MAKKLEVKEEKVEEVMGTNGKVEFVSRIEPLTVEFGNGDMNLLRDKINEIITRG